MNSTIFGTNAASLPDASASMAQREQHVDDYADRVNTQIANIESGSEAERNVKFLNARPFTTPTGYFTGGLLSAGFDPDQPINVTFSNYTGMGSAQTKNWSDTRTYKAWEIAAGMLKHDRPDGGGIVNFNFMHIDPADQGRVNDLESIGAKLQDHWTHEAAAPMQDASGTLAARSGKADAFCAQATLQSLRDNKAAFGRLSPEGQQAVNRTLDHAGQVIIPNVYGYPLAGHAFIPYTPYDGNYEHRPNQGLMVSLNQGTVSEIRGDKDFANWAQRNQGTVLQSFNASDAQGGLDVHWPKAGDVLGNLIGNDTVTYPGYKNLVSDQPIPVRQTFNYTGSRGSDYQLKYGNLGASGGIASQYQSVNAKNASWADQTQVFGASAQNWKTARSIWGNTFGFVPVIGNLGNIVFGAHDSLTGMTPKDRIGGSVAAAISSLQLAHEAAPGAAALASGQSAVALNSAAARDCAWTFDRTTSEFRFTPPQRVNGQIGYPMSPLTPPRIGEDLPESAPTSSHETSHDEHVVPDIDMPSTSAKPSVDQPAGEPVLPETANEPTSGGSEVHAHADDQPGTSAYSDSGSSSGKRHRVSFSTRSQSYEPLIRSNSTDSNWSTTEPRGGSASGSPEPVSRSTSVESGTSFEIEGMISLSAEEDAGFKKYFPRGLDQAQSYLKDKALAMARSPAYLSSDHYPAPRLWSSMSQEEKNQQMERYLSVWDPAVKRADFSTDEAYGENLRAYDEKIGKYKENGNFNVQKYWDDMVSSQNDHFRTYVDNQTKRLAVATKAYDDYSANPTLFHAKPDDPHTLRQQMATRQDVLRDAFFLQREAMDFGKNGFYKLDGRNVDELRGSFLGLFGRENSMIEAAFQQKKSDLEDELYRYGNSDVSRSMVEEQKSALQSRFNDEIDVASKNMDFMYKRIALYGTIGTLSLSAISAILWKAIDEIRQKP